MFLWEFIETVNPAVAVRIDTILVEKNPITEQYEYKGETEGNEYEAGVYPYADINPLRNYYLKYVNVVKFTAIDFNLEGDILMSVRRCTPDMTAVSSGLIPLSPIQIFNPIIQYKSDSSGKQKRPSCKVFFIAVNFTAIPYLSEFPSPRFEALLKTVCVQYRQRSQHYRIYHR